MTQKQFKQHVSQYGYTVQCMYKHSKQTPYTEFVLTRLDLCVTGFVNLKQNTFVLKFITGVISVAELMDLSKCKDDYEEGRVRI